MKYIAFSNLWISLAAVAQTLLSYCISGKSVDAFYLFFIFCATLFCYSVLRIIKLKGILPENYSQQMRWVNSHLKFITFLLLFSFVGITVSFFYLTILQQLLISVAGIISLGYNLPLFNSKITLRKIPFIKSILIAGVWTFCTYVIPLSENEFIFYWPEFLLRFFFFYVISVPFDIRDLKYDDASMKTLPQLVGKSGALFFSWILLITCFCISFDVYENNISIPLSIGYLLTGITATFSLKDRNDLFYPMIIDSMMILQVGLILIYK